MSRPSEPANSFTVQLRLSSDFRYLHEPVSVQSEKPLVGRESDIASLLDRVLHSDGGSFLITGYRGVGKTSFVNRSLAELDKRLRQRATKDDEYRLVNIQLNLAKPMQPVDLMFHVIRCLHSRLRDLSLLDSLGSDVREEIELAYKRTAMTIMRSAGGSKEMTASLPELQIPTPGGRLGTIKMPLGYKATRTSNQQHTYLTYDERAAEFDLIRLSNLLIAPISRRRRWWHLRLSGAARIHLKIVFVLDELDKLDDGTGENAASYLDELFRSFKNLFTTSGITFIFIAGKDTQDRWIADIGRGDSVYESVFAFERYLPCVWTGASGMCKRLFDRPVADGDELCARQGVRKPPTMACLYRYLAYIGRGIPRRILRAMNDLVHWIEGHPHIALGKEELSRVEFYSDLQRLLEEHPSILLGSYYDTPAQRDKRQLSIYYVLDWILHHGEAPFTSHDVVEAANALSNKLVGSVAMADPVDRLMQALLDWSYIQRFNNLDNLQVVDANKQFAQQFRLTDEALIALAGVGPPEETPAAEAPAPKASSSYDGDNALPGTTIGRFRIDELVGMGGFANVYRAFDPVSNHVVALKVLRPDLVEDEQALNTFSTEIRVLAKLNHPAVVRVHEAGEWQQRPFYVLDFVDGVTLHWAVGSSLASPEFVAAIGVFLAEAYSYVHSQGFLRNDIKPDNIMLSTSGKIYVLDLGAVRTEADATNLTLTGTPAYMAPEAFLSSRADARMDIYALGLVLYELASGHKAISQAANIWEMAQARHAGPPRPPSDYRKNIPFALDHILLRCLAIKPEERYQNMEELADALKELAGLLSTSEIASWVRGATQRKSAAKAKDKVRTILRRSTIVRIVPLPPEMEAPKEGQEMSPPPSNTLPPIWNVNDSTSLFPGSPSSQRSDAMQVIPFSATVVRYAVKIIGPDWPDGFRVFPLFMPDIRIGRSSGAEIYLQDDSVSRVQARLTMRDGAYYFFDFGSANGALLDGREITRKTSYKLEHGSEVKFGVYRMVFEDRFATDSA